MKYDFNPASTGSGLNKYKRFNYKKIESKMLPSQHKTLERHPYNVVLTSCAGWVVYKVIPTDTSFGDGIICKP